MDAREAIEKLLETAYYYVADQPPGADVEDVEEAIDVVAEVMKALGPTDTVSIHMHTPTHEETD